jgi:hypothetical protein
MLSNVSSIVFCAHERVTLTLSILSFVESRPHFIVSDISIAQLLNSCFEGTFVTILSKSSLLLCIFSVIPGIQTKDSTEELIFGAKNTNTP